MYKFYLLSTLLLVGCTNNKNLPPPSLENNELQPINNINLEKTIIDNIKRNDHGNKK